MADHARFTVFALVDACVAGQGARAVRILRSLRAGGAEPVVLVWALAREVRTLGLVGAALRAGRPRAEVMSSQRIWSSRVPLVMAAPQAARAVPSRRRAPARGLPRPAREGPGTPCRRARRPVGRNRAGGAGAVWYKIRSVKPFKAPR
ncbi:MAG: hypothetical protein M5U09_24335 [Gammaproteobacteria bacterium]|nr:hypothetical protein [Gammaproteobacteria bacterium]